MALADRSYLFESTREQSATVSRIVLLFFFRLLRSIELHYGLFLLVHDDLGLHVSATRWTLLLLLRGKQSL